MKTHIITTFDKNHLGRAIAFRKSLYIYAPDSHVWFLLLDAQSFEMAQRLNLRDTTLLKAEDLNDVELLKARDNRTTPEFASTCKPAFLLYMIKSGLVHTDDLLTFIDVDILFYAPAEPLFKKVYGSGSITITPHRFPPRRENEKYAKGIYNAGIVFFKNDGSARTCLEEWRLQCLEWCYLRYEDGKIGDQGYLSDWPKKYRDVYELTDKGVNLSTWNIENYTITRNSKGDFFVDGEPLICYHFHGLKVYFDRKNRLRAYPITVFHSHIYKPCLEALQKAYDALHSIDPSWSYGLAPRLNMLRLIKQSLLKNITRK